MSQTGYRQRCVTGIVQTEMCHRQGTDRDVSQTECRERCVTDRVHRDECVTDRVQRGVDPRKGAELQVKSWITVLDTTQPTQANQKHSITSISL